MKQPRERLKAALEKIDKELSELPSNKDYAWKTDGTIMIPDYSTNSCSTFSIRSGGKGEKDLVMALAKLFCLKDYYDKAAKVLCSGVEFTFNNANIQDYIDDISHAVNIERAKEKETTLKAAKKELEKYLSEEDRLDKILSSYGY